MNQQQSERASKNLMADARARKRLREITRFGKNPAGAHNLHVKVADEIGVLIEVRAPEAQSEGDRLAEQIAGNAEVDAALVRRLEEATTQLAEARAKIAGLRGTIAQLDGTALAPALLREAIVRESPAGAVWLLGNAEQGWSAFGYRFNSWAELAAERPDIRPNGVGSDATGPFVRMQSVSMLNQGNPSGKDGG